MKRDPYQPGAASDLESVVAEAYQVFKSRRLLAYPLDVCLGCCVSEELERQMRELPLARLGPRHFYEYNTSAKSETQPAEELRYLIPRMLELVMDGAEIHHSVELYLDRLGRCPPGSVNEKEQNLLDRFALAFFRRSLESADRTFGEDPLALLLMFDVGGISVEPMLDLWLQDESPESTLQFVRDSYWSFWPAQEYSNAFASDRPRFRARIREWMLDPTNRRRFVEKLMRPELQPFIENEPSTGCTPFSLMVDTVFDHLTAQKGKNK